MHKSFLNRRSTATLLAFVVAASPRLFSGDPFFDSPTKGRFLLGPSFGSELFKQCSRATPENASAFWQPSAHQIEELELALSSYLDAREKSGQPIPPKGQAYHRQYVGFKRGTEQFIYGNFYPASAAIGVWKKREMESKQAFGVCDGGPAFWGVAFRMSTKTFEDLRFNGPG